MSLDHAALARECAAIARAAGAAIMRIYDADYTIERKDDASPLTAADLAAHHAIVDGLSMLAPRLPVLSEESVEQASWGERRGWTRYWLVDPLDGTREFIKHNGEFTVNIALIEEGEPMLGVVYAPALGEMYTAWRGGGAHAETPQGGSVAISTRAHATPLVVAGSRSHADPRMSAALEKVGAHELIALGSSLKFCRTAQGRADLYVRYGPTSEWDTAAGQCVLEQAGGGVTRLDGTRLAYNTKESLLNPDFLAFGDVSVDWAQLLRAE
ncbi:MAG: 3'(2'),5'-bisphosphate nucleotidase CysQ [Rudaea sp.]|uniref:3'(2'),5'-bisphosphate nucleotidase CysQ n=1 Tax=Rudaea sp. TaxID=2136325 RepID=UPI0039E286F9